MCVCAFNETLILLEKYTKVYGFLLVILVFFILGRKANYFGLIISEY